MGIRLIVEVLYHAPAEFTTSERFLLVALAEAARDDTRRCWPSMEELIKRTGLSARQVRRVLADLAQRGYEVRVPSGVDRYGRPVFASKGHRTVYRVPAFRQRGTHATALKGDACDRLSGTKGDITGAQRGTDMTAKGVVSVPPSPHVPSENPQIIRARADETAAVIEALRDRTGKTVDEHHAALVVKQLVDGRNGIRDRTAYLTGSIARDPDPARFLPTPTPTPYRREDY